MKKEMDKIRQRRHLDVKGLVQGVGFRPFVYRKTDELNLTGFIRNTTQGVEIEVEGSPEDLDALQKSLKEDLPPLARVDSLESRAMACRGDNEFKIVASDRAPGAAALISPDMATCDACLDELKTPGNRRHRYPFVNCTDCGPRFSIVKAVPYDRSRTTMNVFILCPACEEEYKNPLDRRYHAEPNACPECGPQICYDSPKTAKKLYKEEALAHAKAVLNNGGILAVKGLGGFHLACDARNQAAVLRLRERKHRPAKPLAIMCRDMEEVRRCVKISADEERELQNPRRPILLLARNEKDDSGIAAAVAPGHHDLGVMLPYTPLHHLLFDGDAPASLVMTSGNRSEEPIVTDNDEALSHLADIADGFLLHNRPIWNRSDDSVAYVAGANLVLTRRSRGFVPLPVSLPVSVRPTLAVGAQLCNTFAVAERQRLIFSQHIGDMDNEETLLFFKESVEKFCNWLQVRPEIIAHDLHPDLMTTRFAEEWKNKARLVPVQHHHAHLVSALAAHDIKHEALGFVLDGTGFGTDGGIWGGEILFGSAAGFLRLGRLRALPLPGGEAAIRRPWRTAVAYLQDFAPELKDAPLPLFQRAKNTEELQVVRKMVERRFNTPMTTSAGRLFDAVAALLDVCDDATYEGQAAIELEQLARQGEQGTCPDLLFDFAESEQTLILDPAPLFRKLVELCLAGVDRTALAFGFHKAFATALADSVGPLQKLASFSEVALCGGVFQNRILTRLTTEALIKRGFTPLAPGEIPVNDAGLALGQVLVAAHAAKN